MYMFPNRKASFALHFKNVHFSRIFLCGQARVRTHLSSSNFTTFHDFFHDFCEFFKTLGVAVSFKNSKSVLTFEHFFTLNSSTDTNSGIHQNACRLPCLITPLYLIIIVFALSTAVNNLSNKTSIFHDFQGPTIKFHDFPGLEIKFLNSMTLQVFHDLYEPWWMWSAFPNWIY